MSNKIPNTGLFFQMVRYRKNMLTKNLNSFNEYVLYFEGLFIGLDIVRDTTLERSISQWFQDKVEFKAQNLYWFDQFEICYKDFEEDEKISIFLDMLENFFKENPVFSW